MEYRVLELLAYARNNVVTRSMLLKPSIAGRRPAAAQIIDVSSPSAQEAALRGAAEFIETIPSAVDPARTWTPGVLIHRSLPRRDTVGDDPFIPEAPRDEMPAPYAEALERLGASARRWVRRAVAGKDASHRDRGAAGDGLSGSDRRCSAFRRAVVARGECRRRLEAIARQQERAPPPPPALERWSASLHWVSELDHVHALGRPSALGVGVGAYSDQLPS